MGMCGTEMTRLGLRFNQARCVVMAWGMGTGVYTTRLDTAEKYNPSGEVSKLPRRESQHDG